MGRLWQSGRGLRASTRVAVVTGSPIAATRASVLLKVVERAVDATEAVMGSDLPKRERRGGRASGPRALTLLFSSAVQLLCLGILIFYLIALQCFPTVAVARNEMGSWRPALIQLALFTGGAYILAVAVVQGLRALGFP